MTPDYTSLLVLLIDPDPQPNADRPPYHSKIVYETAELDPYLVHAVLQHWRPLTDEDGLLS